MRYFIALFTVGMITPPFALHIYYMRMSLTIFGLVTFSGESHVVGEASHQAFWLLRRTIHLQMDMVGYALHCKSQVGVRLTHD